MAKEHAAERIKLIKTIAFLVPIEMCTFIKHVINHRNIQYHCLYIYSTMLHKNGV